MRALVAILGLLLVACGGSGASKPIGGKAHTADTDCPEPYRSWIAQEAQEFGWQLVDAGEFTVHCGDTGPEGGVEEYVLGSNTVTFDPEKLKRGFPEFGTKCAVGHGWTHRLIYFGPHPERAKFHVCEWAYNEPIPPYCYPYEAAENVLMSPGGTKEWDGDQQAFQFGTIPEYRVTDVDQKFIDWALSP